MKSKSFIDKYVESGPELKLLGVTFDEHLKERLGKQGS